MPRRNRSGRRPRVELVGAVVRRRRVRGRPARARGAASGRLRIAQPRRRDPLPLIAALAVVLLAAAGVAAYVLVQDEATPPRAAFRSTLGAQVVRYDLASRLTRRTLHEVAVVPAGRSPRRGRPLLVLLHGKGMAPDFFLSDGLFAGLRGAGRRAPVVVALDGGTGSSWHDRRDGRWGSMVLREAIPDAARRLGADPHRVAIAGISMGGFGALDLARRSPGRFCAVGARSPAVFPSARRVSPGAFDDARDFRRHDLLHWARRSRSDFGRTPVWIDRGADDPFAAPIDALARAVPPVRLHRWPGGHDAAYWRAHDRAFTAWATRALRRCPR